MIYYVRIFISCFFVVVLFLSLQTRAQGIEIESGTSISISGSASIEIEDGGLINNGTYSKGTESFIFSGTVTDTISGSSTTDFYDLSNTNSGGMLIMPSTAVTVSNNFSNTGTFSIDSDASGSGSFIVNGTSTGTINYNRYMTGVDKWHLISSPLSGQDIEAFVVTNVATNAVATNGTKYGLAPYNEATQGWEHYTTAAGSNDIAAAGNFIAGKGYEVLRTSDGEVVFTGTINTSNVSIGVTSSGNSWNLVGNPFTSAVFTNENADATNNMLTINLTELNDSYGALYFWDTESSNYITVNQVSEATYVAPGQSFFVYSKDGGGTISLTEAMQTHQTSTTLKRAGFSKSTIRLIAENNQNTSSTQIMFIDNMTTGLDPAYDAGRFSGGNNNFAVYTHLVGDNENKVDFDIQCLPNDDYSFVIPVGLNAPENSEIMFRAQIENLPPEVPVYLEDKAKGHLIDLRKSGSSYAVEITNKISGIGRFYLHTFSETTGYPGQVVKPNVEILPLPHENCIRITGHVDNNNTRAIIYDASGRQLLNNRLNNSVVNNFKMDGFKSGIYYITVYSENTLFSKKIVWVNVK